MFHNLRGYDSHLIMQELGEFIKTRSEVKNKRDFGGPINISVIPNNMENI